MNCAVAQFHLQADTLETQIAPRLLNLVRLLQVPDMVDKPVLKYPPHVPAIVCHPARKAQKDWRHSPR